VPCGTAAPIRSCSRWGLPCRPCCQGRGALLPHRFALARGLPRGACAGGLFSVALSLGSPPPAVSRHRIPVEPGLSSACGQRPSGRLARRDMLRDGWKSKQRFTPRAAEKPQRATGEGMALRAKRIHWQRLPAALGANSVALGVKPASVAPVTWFGTAPPIDPRTRRRQRQRATGRHDVALNRTMRLTARRHDNRFAVDQLPCATRQVARITDRNSVSVMHVMSRQGAARRAGGRGFRHRPRR